METVFTIIGVSVVAYGLAWGTVTLFWSIKRDKRDREAKRRAVMGRRAEADEIAKRVQKLLGEK